MKNTGTIKTWNFRKGFGFAEPDSGGNDIFIHITDLADRSHPPKVGQTVTYTLAEDSQGRKRGEEVQREGDKASLKSKQPIASLRLPLMLGVAFLIIVLIYWFVQS